MDEAILCRYLLYRSRAEKISNVGNFSWCARSMDCRGWERKSKSRRLIANASQGFRFGWRYTRNASCTRSCDAQNKSTRRYNVSDACTRIRCQRTPLVFQRGYRCCDAAMIPPVTSHDLRSARDGNLGSRPWKVDSSRHSQPVPAIFVQRGTDEMEKFPACLRRITRDNGEQASRFSFSKDLKVSK